MSLLKQLLIAVVGIAAPLLYSRLNATVPPFPLTIDQLTQILLWLVGLVFGADAAKSALAEHYNKMRLIAPTLRVQRQTAHCIKLLYAVAAFAALIFFVL